MLKYEMKKTSFIWFRRRSNFSVSQKANICLKNQTIELFLNGH